LVSEPAENQPNTTKFEEQDVLTTTNWGLLKQPDNQMPTRQTSRKTDTVGLVICRRPL
jgi:hypothetical protein